MTHTALKPRQVVMLSIAAALIAVVAVGVGSYAWATAGPRIDEEYAAGMNGSTQVRGPGTVTIYAGELCLDDDGTVELLDVAVADSLHGITVTDFGLVEPMPQAGGGTVDLGSAKKPLREAVRGRPVSRTLSYRCGDNEGFDTFLVELRKPQAGKARARGLDITYRSAGREHTLHVDFDVTFREPRRGSAL
ncbi:hypothetical protein [Mumia sp. Pv 4-285]|uniref:hypothetical protein n=1 Tax=Mumia qirimensis TaxID=3234852 RepID=UPI00351D27CB